MKIDGNGNDSYSHGKKSTDFFTVVDLRSAEDQFIRSGPVWPV